MLPVLAKSLLFIHEYSSGNFLAKSSSRMNHLQLVLLPSMIALASLYDVVLSVHTQFSQLNSQTFNLLSQNSSGCPLVWFAATHNCQCIRGLHLNCEGEIAYTDTRHILTYDSNKEVISAIRIRHKYLKGYNMTVTKDGSYSILLPNNISELNQYMCGPLNRKDYLCSDCKSSYGPAIISESASCANKCYSCKDTLYNVLLYLSLSFIPPTVFYLLILVFHASQADLCPSDMLHHVQSANGVGIL